MMGNHSVEALSCASSLLRNKTLIEEVVYGYLVPMLCAFGFAANVANIFALKSSSFKAPTYIYLSFIAVIHLAAVVIGGSSSLARSHYVEPFWTEAYLTYVSWPSSSVLSLIALLLVVTMSADRYVSLRWSLPDIKGCTKTRAAKCLSFVVCFLSVMLNIPHMTAMAFDWNTYCRRYQWKTEGLSWFAIYSAIRSTCLNLCLFTLMALNILLTKIVNETSELRRHSPRTSVTTSHTRNHSVVLTKNIIWVNILSLTGELPRAVIESVSPWIDFDRRQSLRVIKMVAFCLMIFEYSGTFFVNCVVNGKFRTALCKSQTTISKNSPSANRLASNETLQQQPQQQQQLYADVDDEQIMETKNAALMTMITQV